jgi:hypothetical protein
VAFDGGLVVHDRRVSGLTERRQRALVAASTVLALGGYSLAYWRVVFGGQPIELPSWHSSVATLIGTAMSGLGVFVYVLTPSARTTPQALRDKEQLPR